MINTGLFDLTGKKALVTGGSIGIGRACATALAMSGADVAIIARNQQVGNKTAESIREMGVDSFFIRCDVSDKQQVQEMTASVVERFGRLDIAVNNAGIAIPGDDQTQRKEDWDKVIGVNLTGVWLCAQAQAAQMIKQSPTAGKIINTASIAAKIVGINGAYNASKAGVIHLTRTLSAQLGRYNINVNCFSPGCLMTPMISSFSLEMRQKLRDMTPMGYVQRPEDLYGPIQFLASSASNFVTGQDLVIDGGYTLGNWMEPLTRDIPPLINPEEEIIEMKKDLDAMGIPYDEHGVTLK